MATCHKVSEQPANASSSAPELFVSGRLCLFGEHTDWAGEYKLHNPEISAGRTIVVGTQQGIYARAQRIEREVLSMSCVDEAGTVQTTEIALQSDVLLQQAQQGGFWSYVAGTAYRVMVAHHVGGLHIDNYRTTLPMSKGLSSSAAVCVMVARAFNQVYDLKLTIRGEMEFAYLGEITTPSKCGRMDQACAYGSIPVVMTFSSDPLSVHKATLAATLYLVLVDLKAHKCTTTILQSLQAAYPRPRNEEEQRLHELLGTINQRMVAQALKAMEAGDVPGLGALMKEAQMEFDARAGPVCPSQLKSPVLHKLLTHDALQPLIWGGKGVGSQGDGAAQLLCKGPAEQKACCDIVAQLGMHAMPLTVSSTSQ